MIKSRDEFPLVLPVFFFFSSFVVVNIMLVDNHVRKLKQETKGLDRMAEKNIGQLSFESIYQQYRYLWAERM